MYLRVALGWIALMLCVSGYARQGMVPCGEHPLEQSHPSLVWKKFISIAVRSNVADVDAMICAGKVPGSPVAERITYRDDKNRTLVVRSIEELAQFQILINAEQLPSNIGSVVRSGGLVSLRIGEPTTDVETASTRYPVTVRFHRALGRNASADIREIECHGQIDFEDDSVVAQRADHRFDTLKIFIGLFPIRMEQVVLKHEGEVVDNFFTSSLPRARSLE